MKISYSILTHNEDKSLQKLLEFLVKFKDRFVINEIKGVKPRVYDLISRSNEIKGQYRTYDYLEAKKSAVYLEPIRVFTDED